jgi:hypothetical protein
MNIYDLYVQYENLTKEAQINKLNFIINHLVENGERNVVLELLEVLIDREADAYFGTEGLELP